MRLYKLGDDHIDFVQIYGERNSATTYLSKLVQDNLRTPTNLMGSPRAMTPRRRDPGLGAE